MRSVGALRLAALSARAPAILLGLAAGGALLTWAILASAHWDDLYRIDHAGGVWAASTQAALDGRLYPPLFEDGPLASRYQPLPILAHAGIALLTGELIASGRVLGIATMAALLIAMATVLRRHHVAWPLVAATGGALLLTEPGLEVTLGLRPDALPVALQIVAMSVIARGSGPRSAAAGGVLCALAALSKLTALWGGAAILVWLVLRHERSRLSMFMGSALATAILGLLAVNLVSDGRFIASLTGALGSEAPPGSLPPLPGLPRLLEQLVTTSPIVALLLPAAIVAAFGRSVRGEDGVYRIALGIAAVELVLVFGDRGVFGNHLVPLLALVPLVALTTTPPLGGASRALLAASVIIGLAATFQVNAGDDLIATLRGGGGRSAPALDGSPAPEEEVLSEDPGVEVFAGRRPTIVDPYMLRRAAADPARVEPLLERIRGREFDVVVTVFPLDSDPRWYREYHLGEPIWSALLANYQLTGFSGGYAIYRPTDGVLP